MQIIALSFEHIKAFLCKYDYEALFEQRLGFAHNISFYSRAVECMPDHANVPSFAL